MTTRSTMTTSCLMAVVFISTLMMAQPGWSNPHAKRLFDDLLANYNRLIRPVSNNSDKLTVRLGLKLSQLIDVDLKNQVMTTNVWVVQKWMDYKLRWDPADYGGVDRLYVPSQTIWLPDLVLFNNADGKYEVTLMTKASLQYTGEVIWKPPAIYKSSCKINVEWFPFDEQTCEMKFGSWTYDGYQLDLKHMDQMPGSNVVDMGIDLKEFYLSVEWDILEVPAIRNEEYQIGFGHQNNNDTHNQQRQQQQQQGHDQDPEEDGHGTLLTDITFSMKLRRKTLFYTVNLIIPCVGISFLTALVFYLPSDSGEKVTLCISILISLTVFFLLLAEIIPPTSLAVPLLGKYLLFTMILVTLSICVTVGVLNIHFRSPSTHRMSPWVHKLFIQVMPRLLLMERPNYVPRYSAKLPDINALNMKSNNENKSKKENMVSEVSKAELDNDNQLKKELATSNGRLDTTWERRSDTSSKRGSRSRPPSRRPTTTSVPTAPTNTPGLNVEVASAIRGVEFIAQHIKKADKDNEVVEDWKFIATVLDRLFLVLFTVACVAGTGGIILRAPSLYDTTVAIDHVSEIPSRHN